MADTVTLDPGAGGAVIATDDAGAAGQVQINKLAISADGSATPIPADAANGLDVDVTRSALPAGAATSAKQPALGTAGVASTDVITIQGIASGTVVPVDSELPAAAALADGAANPTSPAIGAFALLWNGATWDRAPGGATNGLTANLKALNGTTIATNSGNKDAGTQRVVIATDQVQLTNALKVDGSAVTQPVSGTVTANLGTAAVTNAGTFAVQIAANSSVNNAQVSGTATSVNSGTKDAGTQRVILASDQTVVPISDNSASLTVDAPVGTPAFVRLSDGSAAITTLPVSLATLPALASGTNLIGRANVEPQTANGLSIFHLVSAATTNATNLKASAGQVYGWYIYNSNTLARKVAFHNTAGTPTAGASVTFAIVIPPSSAANVEYTNGLAFGTGIAITTVTDLTDAGATGVAASDLIINIFFK